MLFLTVNEPVYSNLSSPAHIRLALIELPQMQRRKYSFRGKPHGRNELITEYLWIAYMDSLPPGAVPDEEMRRTRKQVSSHIQVLKGFLRDHPAREFYSLRYKAHSNGYRRSAVSERERAKKWVSRLFQR